MNIDFSIIPSPCFVIDELSLRKNLELISQVQDEAGIEVLLAFKGFAMWSVFPTIREYIKGAAASSLNEARLCFEEMKTKAHTYCVAINTDEIEELISYSSHITFNSFDQFFLYKEKAVSKGVSCGIRVNPGYSEILTPLYNPCAPGSRLGLTSDKFSGALPDGIEGLHFHALCENNSYALENLLKSFEEKFKNIINQVKWVNFGGGHLMTMKGYNINHLIKILKNFREKYNVHAILEPGSAFAWQTGYLVSTILDIVNNHGIKTAIIDVSFTAHMPDCLEMPYKPSVLGESTKNNGKYEYCLGGVSCLAGDFIPGFYFDNELKTGDKIIFEDMIHYTMVKTNMFNGLKHPSIGIWNKENKFILARVFSYEDYKNRLS